MQRVGDFLREKEIVKSVSGKAGSRERVRSKRKKGRVRQIRRRLRLRKQRRIGSMALSRKVNVGIDAGFQCRMGFCAMCTTSYPK